MERLDIDDILQRDNGSRFHQRSIHINDYKKLEMLDISPEIKAYCCRALDPWGLRLIWNAPGITLPVPGTVGLVNVDIHLQLEDMGNSAIGDIKTSHWIVHASRKLSGALGPLEETADNEIWVAQPMEYQEKAFMPPNTFRTPDCIYACKLTDQSKHLLSKLSGIIIQQKLAGKPDVLYRLRGRPHATRIDQIHFNVPKLYKRLSEKEYKAATEVWYLKQRRS